MSRVTHASAGADDNLPCGGRSAVAMFATDRIEVCSISHYGFLLGLLGRLPVFAAHDGAGVGGA